MYISMHVKYPLFLSVLNETWIFSIDFRKILRCQALRKLFQGGGDKGFHADGLTDNGQTARYDEAISRFSQKLRKATNDNSSPASQEIPQHIFGTWHWKNRVSFFAIYIHSKEIHNAVALVKCLLVLRFQLYMFLTVTVHPQELHCRNCMCRLWYVLTRPAGKTF